MAGAGVRSFFGREAGRLGPLRHRAFRAVLVGRVVSSAGSWIQTVAAGWLVFHITHSAGVLGLLTVLGRAPGAVLAGYGGELADRYDGRKAAAVLLVALSAPAFVLAVLADHVTTVELCALTFAMGSVAALVTPVFQALVRGTVPADELDSANSLSGMVYGAAALAGPAIGGALVGSLGVGLCFLVNGLSFLPVTVIVLRLPADRTRSTKPRRAGLRDAVVEARRRPTVFAILASFAVFISLVGPLEGLAPAIARHHAEGAHVLGFLLSAMAAGSLAGSAVVGPLHKRGVPRSTILGAGLLISAIAMLVVGASPVLAPTLVAMFLAGIAWQVLFLQLLTWLEHDAPEDASGRLIGLYYGVDFAGLGLGAIAIGGLIDIVGLGTALGAVAIVLALFAAVVLLRRRPPVDPPGPTVVTPLRQPLEETHAGPARHSH